MTESTAPEKKTKTELEQLIKANGGKFFQTDTAAPDTICVADRSRDSQTRVDRQDWANFSCRDGESGITSKECEIEHCPTRLVAGLRPPERGGRRSFRSAPSLRTEVNANVFLCVAVQRLIISRHMFFVLPGQEDEIAANIDMYGDSFARDTSTDELEEVSVCSHS